MIKDLDDSDLSLEFKTRFKKLNAGQMSSAVLAAYVVAYKAVNVDKQFAIACMAELSRRRLVLDEEFDFEGFIEVELAKMPKVEHMDIVKISKNLKTNIDSLKNIIK